jgi:hypothetical protein
MVAYLPSWLLALLAFAAGVFLGPRVRAVTTGARTMAAKAASS